MPEPYVVINRIGDFEVTAIVIDEHEFESLCDELSGVIALSPTFSDGITCKRVAAEQRNNFIQALKDQKIIPLISRGTKTSFLFERYNVTTDKASVIVRGYSLSKCREAASMN